MSTELSFIDRLKKANDARELNLSLKKESSIETCRLLLDHINEFVSSIESTIYDKLEEITSNGYGYAILYSFNNKVRFGPILNDKFVTESGKVYSIEYILSGTWLPFVTTHFPEEAVSVEDRLQKYVDTNCNNGIDPNTNKPYHISVFWRKNVKKSVLPNGIILSRNGIKYTQYDPGVTQASAESEAPAKSSPSQKTLSDFIRPNTIIKSRNKITKTAS